MASSTREPGGKRANSFDLLERCGVCRQRLRANREPRLLPCLHSLCRECLKAEPGPADASEEPVVECPICKHQCPLKEVVENYFLKGSDAESANLEVNQCCTSCDDNALATSFCVECSEPLCDTCLEAHQRVKYTKDHTVRAAGGSKAKEASHPLYCSVHKEEPLALFCDTCDVLTCRDCQLSTHKDHHYRFLEEAVKNERETLATLIKRLGDKHANLQRSVKEVHSFIRQVTDVQEAVQVDIKMAVIQMIRELQKRSKVLENDAKKVTEGQQEKLERQHWALTKLQRHQEHILRFASWALESENTTALLLCKKPIYLQVHRALKMMMDPVEPQSQMKFQWDLDAWTKSAESFGTIISDNTPSTASSPQQAAPSPSGPNPASGTSQGPLQVVVVSEGQCASSPLLLSFPGPQVGVEEGQRTPKESQSDEGELEVPPQDQCSLGAEGCPQPSPPSLGHQVAERQGETGAGTELAANGHPEATTTGVKRSHVSGSSVSNLLRKVPRVSLERLDLDLSGAAQPPVFRVFPGSSSEDFNLIVIERESKPPPQPLFAVKEEHQEAAISDLQDRKPVMSEPPNVPALTGGGLGSAPLGSQPPPLPPPPPPGPGISCCRVCCQPGAVVMCDRCEHCYHLSCHVPALHEIPSPEWKCLLCQDLPPPSPSHEDLKVEPPQKLSPLDQQRCEYVLLELLCHEPCRPLQRLSSLPEGHAMIDLTLIRAKLQEKLTPHYCSPDEFASDVWRMIRQFNKITEDKADVQSVLGLQSFFESRLNAAFGDRKFSPLPLEGNQGSPKPPPTPLAP